MDAQHSYIINVEHAFVITVRCAAIVIDGHAMHIYILLLLNDQLLLLLDT